MHIHSVHSGSLRDVKEELRIKTEILSTTNIDLLQVIGEKELLIVDLSFMEHELTEERGLRQGDATAGREKMEILEKDKELEMILLVKGNEERMLLLSELHQANLEAETGSFFV